mmetsp:Transcript_3045/g.6967  ORF Transcript_3045/g.6967 Transcript_3045/m.6967 type:complete len:226 (-) Transcript_3045:1850-2527(-)
MSVNCFLVDTTDVVTALSTACVRALTSSSAFCEDCTSSKTAWSEGSSPSASFSTFAISSSTSFSCASTPASASLLLISVTAVATVFLVLAISCCEVVSWVMSFWSSAPVFPAFCPCCFCTMHLRASCRAVMVSASAAVDFSWASFRDSRGAASRPSSPSGAAASTYTFSLASAASRSSVTSATTAAVFRSAVEARKSVSFFVSEAAVSWSSVRASLFAWPSSLSV